MHEAGVAGDAALARRTNEIRVELKFALSSAVAKPVAPFGQGFQTAVAARRVGEGHDGRGVKKASRPRCCFSTSRRPLLSPRLAWVQRNPGNPGRLPS